jgi:murein DD-endopeptidase MepM/ murein hydrolase activator NlpD
VSPDSQAPSGDDANFPDTPEGRLDATAAKVIHALNSANVAALFALFGPAMREALPLDRTETFAAEVVQAGGRIASHERVELRGRTGVYRVIAERRDWRLRLVLNGDHMIIGLNFGDPPDPPPPVTRTAPLRLPFHGAWTVAWGGDNEADNHHISHNNQRRAADLYIVDGEARTHRGEGRANQDYYAYGQDIVSASTGNVVTVINGVPDNVPGSMNGYFALGNAVVVQHGDNEFALYAHLQPDSIRVRVGQRVRPGTTIGRSGNSGNTTEPHLHFHVQTTAAIQDGWGIEPLFSGVALTRGGQESAPGEYTFLRGDRISATD